MSTIFSRLAAVGIIAGGFALTGDLGRLAKRGFEIVHADDVPTPDDGPAADPPAAERPPETGERPAAGEKTNGPGQNAAATASPRPGGVVGHAEFRPPDDGIEQVSLASLTAGDRVVAWLALPRRSGGRAYRCLVFDVIDPATGEALVYEAVSFTADASPKATAVPPRRVRLQGDGLGGAVVRGGMIDLGRRGIAADGVGHESIGPIVALHLVR
jgi:hypothetical protein